MPVKRQPKAKKAKKTKPAKPSRATAKKKAITKAKPKAKAKAKPKAKTARAKKPAPKPKKSAAGKPKSAKAKPAAKRAAPKQAKRGEAKTISVSVTLREHVAPIDRGDRYEDPVFEALVKAGLGGEGAGGGTLCSKEGEILEADFDVEIASPEGVSVITTTLERAGAAKGAELTYKNGGKKVVVPFGITEGVAVYLDGVGQSPDVYESTSADELFDKLVAALGDEADFRGSWQGPTETALYFYGLDAERLFKTIRPVLEGYPLSRNARVVLGHRSPAAREVRLMS